MSLIDTKQYLPWGCNAAAHTYWGKGPAVLSARRLELRASPSLGPNLLLGHSAEEAEVQGGRGEGGGGLIRVTAGLGPSSIPFRSSFWRPLAQHAVLSLKPQGSKSFLERPTTARRTLRRS